jgi:hypothetical protein
MSATGADPRSEDTRLRAGSRTWGLIRRTLPLGRSIGSLSFLISVGLIASWIIAVFFGSSLFFLMPRSAKLASGLSPGGTRFDGSSAETPRLMQSTSRLDLLSSPSTPDPAQPASNAAADKGRPVVVPRSLITASPITATMNPYRVPAEATIAHAADEPPEPAPGLNRGQALTVELGTISAASVETAPMPAAQSQPSTPPEPRGASQPSHSRSSRKQLERRPSDVRTAQPHAPMSAIQDVMQKHSKLLK